MGEGYVGVVKVYLLVIKRDTIALLRCSPSKQGCSMSSYL